MIKFLIIVLCLHTVCNAAVIDKPTSTESKIESDAESSRQLFNNPPRFIKVIRQAITEPSSLNFTNPLKKLFTNRRVVMYDLPDAPKPTQQDNKPGKPATTTNYKPGVNDNVAFLVPIDQFQQSGDMYSDDYSSYYYLGDNQFYLTPDGQIASFKASPEKKKKNKKRKVAIKQLTNSREHDEGENGRKRRGLKSANATSNIYFLKFPSNAQFHNNQ